MLELVASQRQQQFGLDKRDTLPQYCLDCDVRFACHGGCPKDRFVATPDGEPGPQLPLRRLQGLLPPRRRADALHGRAARRGAAPSEIVQLYAAEDARRGRNDPCTCGSGRKWKHCHGQAAASGAAASMT